MTDDRINKTKPLTTNKIEKERTKQLQTRNTKHNDSRIAINAPPNGTGGGGGGGGKGPAQTTATPTNTFDDAKE